MNYFVALTFHPNQFNPARPRGAGVWRVHHSGPNFGTMCKPHAYTLEMADGEPWVKLLYLPTNRLYKERSRVDPRRVLGLSGS